MTSLSDLPPLWGTEARDAADLVLPIRLARYGGHPVLLDTDHHPALDAGC